ncbi:MAG: endonuclease/exonuclease/phosphatase family protein, partial [Alphaproteobacteria bacterium]
HIMVGDLNIAPFENDVWSHKQLLEVVSHTPIEVEKMTALRDSKDWVDTAREFVPLTEKLYSWWSYRNRDWLKSNRGRRLDHIWLTPNMRKQLLSCDIYIKARSHANPSDHVPVVVELAL